ncbi:hypothetical protein GCM10011366_22820 [Ornithinimicrobium tianjinense]|uniref:Uncharacterized protein n=2 Tax=Ornithinimicrobium tianjinense TaxID=1195761 RepID=A0A917BPZ2_9MICO|nr:hypothetical protein GCM10011366_22820 [Ornithinimicrobium tianjinense]
MVLAAWVAAVLLAPGGRVPAPEGDRPALAPVGDAPVVLVGIPGLTWDLVGERTPTLSALAEDGAVAALVVRGAHEVTCPADAWLTLGAGQRAGTAVSGCGDAEGAEGAEGVGAAAGTGPVLDDVVVDGRVAPDAWGRWRAAADRRALGPQLGSLARLVEGAGGCVAAYGPGAVLGAAGTDGAASVARPDGLVGLAALDGPCDVHLVSGPALQDDASSDLADADAALGRLMLGLPAGSRLVVAGLGHTAGRAETTVLVEAVVGADGAAVRDGGGGLLGSASTRQVGLVQLTDLTTALVEAAGASPDDALAGGPVVEVADGGGTGATAGATDVVTSARDLSAAVSGAKRLAPWVLGALAALLLPLLGAAVLLRRPRLVRAVALTAMSVPVATWLAGLLPWWRSSSPGPALVVATLGAALVVAAYAGLGPWRRDPLGPPAAVAAVTMAVVGADVIGSARLGLVSVLGLQPVTAGRFFGQGNVGFGLVLGALLVVCAVLLSRLPRLQAMAGVLVLGVATLVLDAAPQWGADFGGVPGTVLAVGLLTLAALRVRWRPSTVALLVGVGGLVAAAVMVADWARGPRRTHLGDFVQSVLDGEAGGIVVRKLSQGVGILVTYPLSWLAVLALVGMAAVVLTRRPGWTGPLWREAGVRPALLAGLVAMVLTWVLNDSGIAAVALTLAMLIGLGVFVLAAAPEDRGRSGAPRPSQSRPPAG